MSKSPKGGVKDLIPPAMLPELPPHIPQNFPFVQRDREERTQQVEPNDEVETEEIEESSRKKRQSGTDTSASAAKPAYCDGVDEIGCYQVRNFIKHNDARQVAYISSII